MTTDYVTYLGNPEPYLHRIAETGFTHIHWCHEWNTTRLYSREDVRQIRTWLENLGLKLLDLHAPHGVESGWGSKLEEERLASVRLILNRIDMTARLSGGAVVLHIPQKPSNPRDVEAFQTSLRRSLDQLESHSTPISIKIALENMENDNFQDLKQLLSAYDPEFLGLCYDSGHGNIGTPGLDNLEHLRDRLVSIHIHDNNGIQDQHALPFSGTVDWERLSQIMATSSYTGCVSLEANMRGQDIEESEYLYRAYRAGSALAGMIEKAKRLQESSNT